MANIVVGKSTWVSGGTATNMQPGVSHSWTWPLGNINEAITITAHPSSTFNTTYIAVENVQISLGAGKPVAEFYSTKYWCLSNRDIRRDCFIYQSVRRCYESLCSL